MTFRLLTLSLLGVFLLWLVSCGTSSVGTVAPGQVDDTRGGAGVKLGDFEVIRYNAAGQPDPALNNTLELDLTDGAQGLVISVNDSALTGEVNLDIRYNEAAIHPESVEFHDLLGDDSQVLSGSFLSQVPGVAAIGQVGIGDYKPASLSGEFATVYFGSGALRTVSIDTVSVHGSDDGVAYVYGATTDLIGDYPSLEFEVDPTDPPAFLNVKWYASWHRADGNQDSLITIADLTPIGAALNKKVAEDWSAAPADYNADGVVTVNDLSVLGRWFGKGTESYIVEAGDDAATILTSVTTVPWSPFTPPTPPATDGVLGSVFRSWTVTFDNASTMTLAQLQALDVNANGTVDIQITPQRSGENGVPKRVTVPVAPPPPTTRTITVTDFIIRVTGATGGDGDGTIFDADTTDGSVVANSTISVSLAGISGTYSSQAGAGAFNETTFPGDMTQQDYDDALAQVRSSLAYTAGNAGAAGARFTTDWVVFGPPEPDGDPGDGDVFPDDDPESDAGAPEGTLVVDLQAATDSDPAPERELIVSAANHTFNFDVTTDPAATVLDQPIDPQTQQPVDSLTLLVNSTVQIPITVPGGTINDPTITELELHKFPAAGGNSIPPAIVFTLVDGADQAGEFDIKTGVGGIILTAIVSGVAIDAGSFYHFRAKVDGVWSSVNMPEDLLTTADPPGAQELLTVPPRVTNDPSRQSIMIFYDEPKVRRDTRFIIDPIGETITPTDPNGFNDILKTSGDEFVIGINSGQIYPRFTVIAGTMAEEGQILADTEGLPGMNVVTREAGRIVVNVLAAPQPDQGELSYVYKLFNEDDSVVGAGSFFKQALGFEEPNPSGVQWGVNVFDRAATDGDLVDDRQFTDFGVQGSTIFEAEPDVLWFEFNGGTVWDADGFAPDNNVKAVMELDNDNIILAPNFMNLELRIVGVGANNNYIAIHTVTDFDFFDPLTPGWPGNFIAGENYFVHLQDPTKPGQWQFTYPQQLFVEDAPPN
jgi:hypothetical protein